MGDRVGLRRHTKIYPQFTSLLCRYVRALMPGLAFAAVACFTNLAAGVHTDPNNEPGSLNWIAPLTSFVGGQVKIHTHPPKLLQVAKGPCTLDPSVPHSTCPWQGTRTVLVAYLPKNVKNLALADLKLLSDLGFKLDLNPLVRLPLLDPATLYPEPKKLPPAAAEYPVVLELFAGTARVSACLKSLGIQPLGVDSDPSKARVPCLQVDLASAEGRSLVLFWLGNPRLAAIFAAPMCGTCSRARELGCGPPPLRSLQHPDGLPFLSPSDAQRVQEANAAYHCLTLCLQVALARGLLLVVENPLRSLFWLCSAWKPFVGRLHFAWCHACAYGSTRPKKTAFASNSPLIRLISRFCAGPSCEKFHEPWGPSDNAPTGFSTSLETAYPPLLAMRLAWIIGQCLLDSGWCPPVALPAPHDHILSLQAVRACAGSQPKASRFPPLVPDAKAVVVLKSCRPLELPCGPMQRLPKPWEPPSDAVLRPPMARIPKNAQLLRASPLTVNEGLLGDKVLRDNDSFFTWEYAWAIPHTEEEFIKKAADAGHPRKFESQLPVILKEAIEFSSKASQGEIALIRTAFIAKWTARAKDLQQEEEATKRQMPPAMAILRKKRLLVWKEILLDLNYPDPQVVDEVMAGCELTGQTELTGMFPPTFKPASQTVEQAQASALETRVHVLSSMKPQGELDDLVFQKTQEEIELGWLQGPIDASRLSKHALISKRFGLIQGKKLRMIDDFSIGGANRTVQALEKPQPHSLDMVAAVLASLLPKSKFGLLGKTFDLSSAYRQLAVAPSSEWCSYIACMHPSKGVPEVYRMLALPFGASKAVYTFLRVAISLWYIGVKGMRLPWSDFFDDFVTLTKPEAAEHTELAVGALFTLLGWDFARIGAKALEFASEFQALGVTIRLGKMAEGIVEFCNTEKRILELKETLESVLGARKLCRSHALKLKGRMHFASSQLWGRSGQRCVQAISHHAFEAESDVLEQKTVIAIKEFLRRLCQGAPKVISHLSNDPMYVFTDACYQPNVRDWQGGIGGVLVDARGVPLEFFSAKLERRHLQSLGAERSRQIILEAETVALIVAARIWGALLRGRPTVFYIDNTSARDICVSNNPRTETPRKLMDLILKAEEEFCLFAWYARVPSPSNPSDRPSREEMLNYSLAGFDLAHKPCVEVLDQICREVIA